MKISVNKSQQEKRAHAETVHINGHNYDLTISRRLKSGSNGLLKLVVQNTKGEVIRNYALLRAIAEVLDNKYQCQTGISADTQKRPVIVMPNRALTK